MSEGIPDALEFFKPGSIDPSAFSASTMNGHVAILNALRKLDIQDYEGKWSDANVVFRRKDKTREAEGGGGASEFGVFCPTTMGRNHFAAQRVTVSAAGVRTLSGASVLIAKPDELRAIGWDATERVAASLSEDVSGYKYDYNAGADARTKTLLNGSAYGAGEIPSSETVQPPYLINHSVVLAVKTQPFLSVSGTPLEWIDLNLTSRKWELVLRKVRICVEGPDGTALPGPYFALFPASNAFLEE